MVEQGSLLVVEGKLQHQERGTSVLADRVRRIGMDESTGEVINQNSGKQYERMLENYLPDIRLLSRYRVGEDSDPKPAEEFELLEELENRKMNYGGSAGIRDEETTGETFLADPPELPDDPVTLEPELQQKDPETAPQTPTFVSATMNSTSVESTVSIVEAGFGGADRQGRSPERITRKIHHLHGWLGSHPGEDQSAFQFYAEGRWQEYVFPNESVQISESLLNQLNAFVEENSFFIRTERFEVRNE